MVYVDDQLLTHSTGLALLPAMATQSSHGSRGVFEPLDGSLFIGGLPQIIKADVEASLMTASVDGLVGTIKDMAFVDDKLVLVYLFIKPKCTPMLTNE